MDKKTSKRTMKLLVAYMSRTDNDTKAGNITIDLKRGEYDKTDFYDGLLKLIKEETKSEVVVIINIMNISKLIKGLA